MKVFSGVFYDNSDPGNLMNDRDCIAIIFEGDDKIEYRCGPKKYNGEDYGYGHTSSIYSEVKLRKGYIEMVPIQDEVEQVKQEPLNGLKEFFGQELKSLQVEFK